ncbi:hypothetical protein CF24_002586, partial [Escherichia coli]|nr:hypothetical protein [Escherichia coli]EKI2961478.1 hypothetical protein [Escherichia coli]
LLALISQQVEASQATAALRQAPLRHVAWAVRVALRPWVPFCATGTPGYPV